MAFGEMGVNPVDVAGSRCRLTTHSTGLAISKSFIFEVDSPAVNSGVRLLPRTVGYE
jgi:hypothetical protein